MDFKTWNFNLNIINQFEKNNTKNFHFTYFLYVILRFGIKRVEIKSAGQKIQWQT